MKKTSLLLLPLLIILAFLLSAFWWQNVSQPMDPEGKPRDFLITRGQSAETIARRLEEEGFIRSNLALRLYLQFRGRAGEIKAGDYRLSPSLSLQQVALTLLSGPRELWVTYPEGFRREQIAARTISTLQIPDEDAQVFWQEFLNQTQGLEGRLFPDTYLFARDVSAETVVEKLLLTFEARFTDEMAKDSRAAGLGMDEVVILASIVERETKTDQERPVVAGILIKRLRNGWPLQADATLQYLIGGENCVDQDRIDLDCDWWPAPSAQDRNRRSAYNTYLFPGLPPGPIANPGLASLEAVIYPEDSPYWFYLHDAEGKIHYAKTIEEHEENIGRFLR